MQDLSLNFPTVAIVLVIVTLAVLAIRRMVRRGLCDCGDHCGDGLGSCAGCPHCATSASLNVAATRPSVAAIQPNVAVIRPSAAATRPSAAGVPDADGEVPPCCRAAERMVQAAAKAAGDEDLRRS